MNFAIFCFNGGRGTRKGLAFFVFSAMLALIIGCGDNIQLPTAQELAAFEKAGPLVPEIDLDRLVGTQGSITRYHITEGDLLEVRMPASLAQTSILGSEQAHQPYQHLSRVDNAGQITMPIVGSLPAKGLLLSELEAAIVAAYYPRYTLQKPAVVVRVSEHHTAQVSVSGAVQNPGIYELPSHKMTLVSAIMAAGGIVEKGAAIVYVNQPGEVSPWLMPQTDDHESIAKIAPSVSVLPESQIRLSFQQTAPSGRGIINVKDGDKLLYAEELEVTDTGQRQAVVDRICRAHPQVPESHVAQRLCELANIIRPGTSDCSQIFVVHQSDQDPIQTQDAATPQPSGPLMLPVKGMNIPFSDIALREGASVIIEPINPQVFTVIGMVKRPGAFPYPPGAAYNLLDALGFAGGVDEVANPRYLRVYRRTQDDHIVDATFEIRGNLPTSAVAMLIKPGDVVAVEQTPRTRTNLILSQVLRFQFGVMTYYRLDDM